jgi:FtsZ-interacting cell division protein YlmF
MANINFDSNQMEKDFIELYKSGELSFEKFDEYTKSLIKTTKEMHEKEEEVKQKIAEEETKQKEEETKQKEEETKQKEEETKQKEEETKQKIKECDTKQTTSNNTAKNVENVSNAAIEWSRTLRPILVATLLLFEGGREIYNQMCKKPENTTNNNAK